MYLKGTNWKEIKWTHLAQDRVHWRAVLKTVMNAIFKNNVGNMETS
jgi:hypothetical protein